MISDANPIGEALQRPSVYQIGTAGWSYDDWWGTFYPPKRTAKFNCLSYYHRYFNFVEVNASFYAVLPPQYAEKWCRDVEDRKDFTFAIKLWQGLTHERPEVFPYKEVSDIKAMCRLLTAQDRLGALLIQFPWSFRYNDTNTSYMARLLDLFTEFPCVVEVRHSAWLQDKYIDFLRDRAVAFCNIDQPQLQNCLRPTSVSTAPFSYLRFHGRNYANWFRENADEGARYDYLYNTEELDELAALARALADQASRVMIAGNNHFQGQAATNALMLNAQLEGKVEQVPASLLHTYPALAQIPVVRKEEDFALSQTDLFSGQM